MNDYRCEASKRIKTKTTAEWLREHAEHGGVFDITSIEDPPYMIRRECYCGAKHVGMRDAEGG